jgi:polyisoprenoid-binding protein YceI
VEKTQFNNRNWLHLRTIALNNSPASVTDTAVQYILDSKASQFTAQVFSGGLFSAFGHSPTISIREFSGVLQVNADEPERSSLKLMVNPSALAVKDDISDKDRREIERVMKDEILEIERFPEIVYECSSVSASKAGEGQYTVTLNGELTMHGVTREQMVPARIVFTGDSLRAFGTFSLRQTDYELKLASVAGGALKVKDELKGSFNILARKKE